MSNTKQPLVCICIPNYNNETTIAETINSLLEQTYKNIIIKIFDNASTDNSIKVLRSYEKKYDNIQVFQNEVNIGGEANFTKCIQNAEGKYTAIFHADDWYLPQMIEKQVLFLKNNNNCSAVAVKPYIANEKSEITQEGKLPTGIQSKQFFIFDDSATLFKSILKYSNFITCPSVMAKSEIYKNKIQIWNGAKYKTSADLDIWLRLAEFGKFGIITEPLMAYRRSIHSYSYNNMRNRVGENDMFLVLDDYINKERYKANLSKQDIYNYHFLLFKDNINRTINQIISNNKSDKLPITIFNKNILKTAFLSNDNFKIYIIGIIVCILRIVPLPTIIRQTIYKYRFR